MVQNSGYGHSVMMNCLQPQKDFPSRIVSFSVSQGKRQNQEICITKVRSLISKMFLKNYLNYLNNLFSNILNHHVKNTWWKYIFHMDILCSTPLYQKKWSGGRILFKVVTVWRFRWQSDRITEAAMRPEGFLQSFGSCVSIRWNII